MYDKTLFAKSFGTALGILLIIAAIGVYGGLAYAVPVAGMGSYTTVGDDIVASSAVVYPQVDSGPGGENNVAVVELQDARIEGLEIRKNVGGFDIVVSADDVVESEEMLLKTSNIEASGSDVIGAEVDANTPGEANRGFEVRCGGQMVEDGQARTVNMGNTSGDGCLHLESWQIETHYLVTNEISIPDLSISIEEAGSGGNSTESGAGE
jgi:hypothetical protein